MASNTIKGLTVEIGGDTTKLGDALEKVNTKSKNLSSELGEINKLLKMDPKNTDLLAQKQKVLSQAIDTTANKLNTLKEAEKQVQRQFEKGEASEEQVRALQREIIATEKKMDSYKNALRETSNQLDDFGQKTDDAGEKTNKFGGAVKAIGAGAAKGFGVITAAVGAAAGTLAAIAESTREYRTEMGKLDTAFTTAGHSVEAAKTTYQSLQGVLGETDQAVEAASHLAKLASSEEDLAKWTDIATGVYATFGASLPIEGLTEAANETAKVGQVTGPLADALNWAGASEDAFNESLAACTTEQERQTLIMETLSGLYSDAATSYKETNAEVIKANEANEAWAASMAEIGAEVEPLLTGVKMLGVSLLSDLMPGIKDVTGAFGAMLEGGEGAAEGLGDAVGNLFTGILNKALDLLPRLIDVGIDIVTSVGTAIIGELPNAIPKIVTAIAENAPKILDAGLALFGALVKAIPPTAVALLKALPQIWTTMSSYLMQLPSKVVDIGKDIIAGLVDGMLDFDLLGAVKGLADSVVNGFRSAFDIHSPSRVMAEIGEFIDEGLAVGIEDNADAPKKAMSDVSAGVVDAAGQVDGMSIERQINQSYTVNAAASAAQNAGMISKLDQILKAIERGQIIALDGNALVGGTVNVMNNALGQRRILAERGAV